MSDIKRLFWDIETCPNIGLFWKSGWKISIPPENILQEKKIITICWKWEDHKRAFSLTWDKGDDRKMIEEFLPVLEEADEAVAHNGDGFDVKWFNTQCLQYGLVVPYDVKTVDTLAICRRRFYLNSNKLDYIANLLFGEGKKKTEDTYRCSQWGATVDLSSLRELQHAAQEASGYPHGYGSPLHVL
jgi:DNA polymerase elongation subunit (family B)